MTMRATIELSPIAGVWISVVPLLVAAAFAVTPWQTVAQYSAADRFPFDRAAFVAGDAAAARRFTGYLRPADRAGVANVDFRRRVVVAALSQVPDSCFKLQIVRLRRIRATLVVTAAIRPPPREVACILVVGWAYHVVSIPRHLVARPLPRRVVLRRLPTR